MLLGTGRSCGHSYERSILAGMEMVQRETDPGEEKESLDGLMLELRFSGFVASPVTNELTHRLYIGLYCMWVYSPAWVVCALGYSHSSLL